MDRQINRLALANAIKRAGKSAFAGQKRKDAARRLVPNEGLYVMWQWL
jgi:hypothetical protein